jgi:hypothetical protein
VEGTTGLLIGDGEATMRTDRTLAQADLKQGSVPGLWAELSGLVARLRRDLFSGYRPELHYMRGPGPACRAKLMGAKLVGAKLMGATPKLTVDPGVFPEAAFATPALRRDAKFLQQRPLKLEVALQVAPEFRWA